MIIQRKQYGCVQMLLVQIGLALYVIVIFLAQTADGGVSPKVLKIQKVAEANLTKLQGQQQDAALLPTAAEQQIFALLAAPQTDAQIPPVVLEAVIPTTENFFPNTSTDLNSLGSKPRAPSVIA
jgi:hypothetical protein